VPVFSWHAAKILSFCYLGYRSTLLYLSYHVGMRCVGIMLILVFGMATCFCQEPAHETETGATRRVASRVEPVYPELAKKMHIDGTVRVLAVVSPTGKVSRTEVIGCSPVLAQAAENVIAKWKWVPASEETKEVIQLKFLPQP
jgi:TonB family protein